MTLNFVKLDLRIACIAIVAGLALSYSASAQITEIIDVTGDGLGNEYRGSQGIAVDASGNVYSTADEGAFKRTPGGVITQIIDGNGGGSGSFLQAPGEIAVDGLGNVYVVGIQSDNVFKIEPGGVTTEIINFAGDGLGNILDRPQAIAVDDIGTVYVAGIDSHNAFKITPAGTITEIIDVFADGAGNFLMEPRGITVDATGNVYVTGSTTRNAFKVTPGGTITEIIDFTGDGAGNALSRAYGIAVDNAENVYVTGSFSNNAFKITPGGSITQIIDSSGDGMSSLLSGPFGITVTSTGRAYVVGNNSRNVLCISTTGVITSIIQNAGGVGPISTWSRPTTVAVDASGDVYVNGETNAFLIDLEQVYRELCVGDGGDQAGCTNCPCMNNAPVASSGGCLNSAGTGARLQASGDSSVSLPSGIAIDLRFQLSGAPSGAFCILNSGDSIAPTGMGNLCLGLDSGLQASAFDGLRCAVINTRRHGGRPADGNGDVGLTNNPWGGEAAPTVGLAVAGGGFVAGQTRYFQAINRDDPLAACMRGLNTSQAVEVVFTP